MTSLTDEERAALDPVTRAHLNVYGYLPIDAPPPSYLSHHAQKLDAELRAAGFPGFAQYSHHDIGESYTEASKRQTALRIEKLRESKTMSLDIETVGLSDGSVKLVTAAVVPAAGSGCLMREWHGETHVVSVLADGGFEYRGVRYGSLSKIAGFITKCSTSGPAFFRTKGKPGRRDGNAPVVVASAETDVLQALASTESARED
jgi:hypothetical protein